VTLGDLVAELVGEERYTAACVWAYNTATDDEFAPWPTQLAVVPELLQAAIWDAGRPIPAGERLAAALELYRAMPCAPNAVALARHWDELTPDDRAALLENDDERLAAPIAHVISPPLPAEPGCDHRETQ
jgi:hypothetical protein